MAERDPDFMQRRKIFTAVDGTQLLEFVTDGPFSAKIIVDQETKKPILELILTYKPEIDKMMVFTFA